MAIIALLILVVFDAEQLPGLMRQAGRMYAKVRGASDELRRAFNSEVARAESDQRREELERRRDEVVKMRSARAKPAVPANMEGRPAPDDAVMRTGPREPTPGATEPTPAADPPPTDSGGDP